MFLDSVLPLEEKVQLSELVIAGPLTLLLTLVAGGPIPAKGTVKV